MLGGHAPACRYRGEERPAFVRRELRRTVVASVDFQQVAVVVDVVQAEKRANRTPFCPGAGDAAVVRTHREVDVVDRFGQQLVVVGIEVLHLRLLVVVADHRLEVVLLGERIFILGILVRREVNRILAQLRNVGLGAGQRFLDARDLRERRTHAFDGAVVVLVAVGEVAVYAQFVVEERSLRADRVVHVVVDIGAPAVAVEQVAHGIDGRHGHRAVGVPYRRRGVSFVGDVAPDVAVALRIGHRVVVFIAADVEVVGNLEPRFDLVADFQARVEHLVLVGVVRAVVQAAVTVVASREVVVELTLGARYRHVVRLGEDVILVNHADVVGLVVEVDPAPFGRAPLSVADDRAELPVLLAGLVLGEPCGRELLRLVDARGIRVVVVVVGVVEVFRPGVAVGFVVGNARRHLEREVGRIADRGLAFLRALGGDEHHAVGSA